MRKINRYQVWQNRNTSHWLILDTEAEIGVDLLLNPVGFLIFETFKQLQEFYNSEVARRVNADSWAI